jgi:hypothetical protein
MTDIMMVFACFNQSLYPTALRQLMVMAQALLAMTGRVTMLYRPCYPNQRCLASRAGNIP